jgi:hypothetical protein
MSRWIEAAPPLRGPGGGGLALNKGERHAGRQSRVERDGADVRVGSEVLDDLLPDLPLLSDPLNAVPVGLGLAILEESALGTEIGDGCCAHTRPDAERPFSGRGPRSQGAVQGEIDHGLPQQPASPSRVLRQRSGPRMKPSGVRPVRRPPSLGGGSTPLGG